MKGNVNQECDRAEPAYQRRRAWRAGWTRAAAETEDRSEKLREASEAGRPLPRGNKDNRSSSAPEPHTSIPRRRRTVLLTGDARAPGTTLPSDRPLQGGATT